MPIMAADAGACWPGARPVLTPGGGPATATGGPVMVAPPLNVGGWAVVDAPDPDLTRFA